MEDIVILSAGDNFDLASIRSEFEGVGEKIDEDIMEAIPIGIDEETFWNVYRNGEVFIHWLDLIDISSYDLREKDWFSIDEEMARFNPGKI
jgi:hypothetical protein